MIWQENFAKIIFLKDYVNLGVFFRFFSGDERGGTAPPPPSKGGALAPVPPLNTPLGLIMTRIVNVYL